MIVPGISYEAKIAIQPLIPVHVSGQDWYVNVVVWNGEGDNKLVWASSRIPKIQGAPFPDKLPLIQIIGGVEGTDIGITCEKVQFRFRCAQIEYFQAGSFETEIKKFVENFISNIRNHLNGAPKDFSEYISKQIDKKMREVREEIQTKTVFTKDDLIFYFNIASPSIERWMEDANKSKKEFIDKVFKWGEDPIFTQEDGSTFKSLISFNEETTEHTYELTAYYKLLDCMAFLFKNEKALKPAISLIKEKKGIFLMQLDKLFQSCKRELIEKNDPEDWLTLYQFSQDKEVCYPPIFNIRRLCIAYAQIFPSCLQKYEEWRMKASMDHLHGTNIKIYIAEAKLLRSLPLLDFYKSQLGLI